MDVEDEDPAGVQAAGPEVAAVVREAAMVRLVAATDRCAGDHLTIGRGPRTDIDRHQLVRAVAHTFHAKGPDIDIILLTCDLRHERRHACFIRQYRSNGTGEKNAGGQANRPNEMSLDEMTKRSLRGFHSSPPKIFLSLRLPCLLTGNRALFRGCWRNGVYHNSRAWAKPDAARLRTGSGITVGPPNLRVD